jgi:hypothetical protein
VARARGDGPTWIEVGVQNGGFRQTIKALGWAYAWAVAREAIGHDPSVEEFADWWNYPVRTAFRDQAAFRACYPNLDTPGCMFEDRELRATLATLADAADRTEGKVRSLKRRLRPSESSILRLGMTRATA